jgi:hypothetical protein
MAHVIYLDDVVGEVMQYGICAGQESDAVSAIANWQ